MSKKNNKSKKEEKFGVSLIEGICSQETKDISADYLEIGLDSFLDNGVLKEIPIIKSFLAFYKTGTSIRDALFIKKLLVFIKSLDDVPFEEREQFLVALNNDPNFKKKLGNSLTLILDRLDDLQKPVLIAKIFESYVRGASTYEEFSRMAAIIDKVHMLDIESLLNSCKESPKKENEMVMDCDNNFEGSLVGTGLTAVESEGLVTSNDGTVELYFSTTNIGWKLLGILKGIFA